MSRGRGPGCGKAGGWEQKGPAIPGPSSLAMGGSPREVHHRSVREARRLLWGHLSAFGHLSGDSNWSRAATEGADRGGWSGAPLA